MQYLALRKIGEKQTSEYLQAGHVSTWRDKAGVSDQADPDKVIALFLIALHLVAALCDGLMT